MQKKKKNPEETSKNSLFTRIVTHPKGQTNDHTVHPYLSLFSNIMAKRQLKMF